MGPKEDRWPAEQKKLQSWITLPSLRHVRRNSAPCETPGLSVVTPNYHQQQHPAAPMAEQLLFGRTALCSFTRRKEEGERKKTPMWCQGGERVGRWAEKNVRSVWSLEVLAVLLSKESLFLTHQNTSSFLSFLCLNIIFFSLCLLNLTLCPTFPRQQHLWINLLDTLCASVHVLLYSVWTT